MAVDSREIGNLKATYDVVVVGGGPAGICAAAQAALLGASTLCVEKYGILGGTMVVAGVEFPGLFHAYGRQVIAGIGWDLVRRSAELAGRPLPDFTREYGEEHWRHHVSISAPIFAALADQRVLDSGADLLFHAMPAAAEPAPDGWSLTLCLKEGLRKTSARILIDCTGDANLAALAGCEVRRSPRLQPATLMMKVGGYDLEALDLAAIERAFAEAVSRGEVFRQDLSRADDPCRNFLAAAGRNRNHVPDVDAWDSFGKTQAEVAGRRSMLRILHFFRRQPGLEHFRIESCAMECGVRETRTIVGDVQVTGHDYISGRAWPDAVCYSFYPIDIHRDDGLGIDIRQPDRGVCPTVPRGCMLPAGSRGLLAAGRCVSSDKVANSALRTQPSCMAMGQAAGAMAALAAKSGRDIRELPIASIRAALRDHGAIVPRDSAG